MEAIQCTNPFRKHIVKIAYYRSWFGRLFNAIFWRHHSHYHLEDLLLYSIQLYKEVVWKNLINQNGFGHTMHRYIGIFESSECRASTFIIIERHSREISKSRNWYRFILVIDNEITIETTFRFRPSYPVVPIGEKIGTNIARDIHELFMKVHKEQKPFSSPS